MSHFWPVFRRKTQIASNTYFIFIFESNPKNWPWNGYFSGRWLKWKHWCIIISVCFDMVVFAVECVVSRSVSLHFTCDLVTWISTWYRGIWMYGLKQRVFITSSSAAFRTTHPATNLPTKPATYLPSKIATCQTCNHPSSQHRRWSQMNFIWFLYRFSFSKRMYIIVQQFSRTVFVCFLNWKSYLKNIIFVKTFYFKPISV